MGQLDIASGQVTVNADLLCDTDPTDLLETLAHENRHGLQELLVAELEDARRKGLEAPPSVDVDWDEVELWRDSASSYSSRRRIAYTYNPLEVDANNAAGHVMRGYMEQSLSTRERRGMDGIEL